MDDNKTPLTSSDWTLIAPARPPATDHRLDFIMSHLTGSDVEIIGTKVDGTPYERALSNVSFKPAKGRVMVIGFDDEKGQVRQFDMGSVATMHVVGGAKFDKAAILRMLDRATRNIKEAA
jgi:hypothetical protein